MGRILAIDYGTKRTGLAVTDPHQIIATALDTIDTEKLSSYLISYFTKEEVEVIVIGMPKKLNNEDSEMTANVKRFVVEFEEKFPDKKITLVDERFTTSLAQQAMIQGGMRKSQRRQKGTVDKISATLILQSFLASRK